MAKIAYKSKAGGLSIPAFVFTPLQPRGPKGHPALVWVHPDIRGHVYEYYIPYVQEAVKRGYVVIAPEYRGSYGYGAEHYDAIDYGGEEVDDVTSAMEYLKTMPIVDTDRARPRDDDTVQCGARVAGVEAREAERRRPRIGREGECLLGPAHVPLPDVFGVEGVVLRLPGGRGTEVLHARERIAREVERHQVGLAGEGRERLRDPARARAVEREAARAFARQPLFLDVLDRRAHHRPALDRGRPGGQRHDDVWVGAELEAAVLDEVRERHAGRDDTGAGAHEQGCERRQARPVDAHRGEGGVHRAGSIPPAARLASSDSYPRCWGAASAGSICNAARYAARARIPA